MLHGTGAQSRSSRADAIESSAHPSTSTLNNTGEISSAVGTAAGMIGAALPRRNSAKQSKRWVKKDVPKDGLFDWNQQGNDHDVSIAEFSPVSLFELFLSDNIVTSIAIASTEYARQQGNNSFVLTNEDVRVFMAILFTSGYATLPARRMYWECSPDVHNEAIAKAMTRNRFEEILRYFHIADNMHLDRSDNFSKVRPLITELNELFIKYFPMQQQLSVDESMIPYFGNHSAKQFIRGKPIRFGYKMWCMTTSLGYLIQFDPYQGASKTAFKDVGMGGSVVLNLISCLPNDVHFQIYFDNLFTSVPLLEKLSQMGIGGTGTVRNNRLMGCPLSDLSKAPRGTYDYKYDATGHVALVRWKDSCAVTLASNCNRVYPIVKAKRWSNAEKARIEIDQPFLISQYNKFMGGVDRLDQNIAQYRIGIRIRKWYWPIVAYLFQVSMQNAWLLYRGSPAAAGHPLSHLQFIRSVCDVYYAKYSMSLAERPLMAYNRTALARRCPDEVRFDGQGHFIERNATQIRCAVCNMKVYKKCVKCCVGLHLDCFAGFHTKMAK